MIVFMFTGLNATSLLFSKTAPGHRPRNWKGTYQEVLPYLKDAFGLALQSFVGSMPAGPLNCELGTLVSYLC